MKVNAPRAHQTNFPNSATLEQFDWMKVIALLRLPSALSEPCHFPAIWLDESHFALCVEIWTQLAYSLQNRRYSFYFYKQIYIEKGMINGGMKNEK